MPSGYSDSQPRVPAGDPRGGQWSSTGTAAGGGSASGTSSRGDWSGQEKSGIQKEKVTSGDPEHNPDVEHDSDDDGVTDSARVGIPGKAVVPPPKVPRLPNLTAQERAVESAFAEAFEKDPDGMAKKYLEMIRASDNPSKFEADAAKNLFEPWAGKGLSTEARSQLRSTMNTPLHQTANAIAKRAFLMHLDGMTPEEKARGMLVTVGGCGAGKGFALKTLGKTIPEFDQKRYGATWDSAGDQNATENPWLLQEAARRGIKVTYAYVSADPKVSWAHPERGVISRAKDPADGRMVDAAVFADSYVIGAKNHSEFAKRNAGKASFIYVANGGDKIERLSSVPSTDIYRNRKELRTFAVGEVRKPGVPRRIRRGALVGERIW